MLSVAKFYSVKISGSLRGFYEKTKSNDNNWNKARDHQA